LVDPVEGAVFDPSRDGRGQIWGVMPGCGGPSSVLAVYHAASIHRSSIEERLLLTGHLM